MEMLKDINIFIESLGITIWGCWVILIPVVALWFFWLGGLLGEFYKKKLKTSKRQ